MHSPPTRVLALITLSVLMLSTSCSSCADERDGLADGDMGADALLDADGDSDGDTPGGDRDGISVCAEAKIDVSEAIPTVILLIDRSGSMQEPFAGTNRWEAVYDALMAEEDGLVSSFEGDISFGLALYTSDDGGPSCPELVQVSPKLLNRDDIDAVYAPIPIPTTGDTPTGDALTGVLPMFDGLEAQGPRVVLLATDGEPDTCAEPDPQNGQDEAISAAQNAFARGIKTFILSVGDDVSEGHLEDMARAGSGLAADTPDPPAFRANDRAGLITALTSILERNRSCVFTIEGSEIVASMADKGRVTLGGQRLEFGTEWTFHQSSPPCLGSDQCIELQGNACERLLEEEVELEAIFPCDAIVFL